MKQFKEIRKSDQKGNTDEWKNDVKMNCLTDWYTLMNWDNECFGQFKDEHIRTAKFTQLFLPINT